ncbi:MAG: hypothetical protein LDL53_10765 [Candidatus Hydrogenedens sp.]|nr:hypothetical protein [Candidatus Hydrogenedens sp.]
MKFSLCYVLFLFVFCLSMLSFSEEVPKTILFSASPEQILKDAKDWKSHGVDAFFLDYVAREWSDNIWASDKKPWTIGKEDETFQKVSEANKLCKELGMETFLKISFDHFFDWFSDLQWENVIHNFRQFAIFAKESGCTGFAIDIEYIGEQYNFNWKGYTYDGYTRKDLIERVQKRSADLINTIYDVFPDMVFLTFPEQGLNLGLIIHLTWIEESAKRKAKGGVHYCVEHTYRLKNLKEILPYISGVEHIFLNYLSPDARKYWMETCSVAPGIWPFGYDYDSGHKAGYTVNELEQVYGIHLVASRKYNWIYSHNCYEQLLTRQKESFVSDEPLETFTEVLRSKKPTTEGLFVEGSTLLKERDYEKLNNIMGYALMVLPMGPDDNPRFQTVPLNNYDTHKYNFWELGKRYLYGEETNFQILFKPIIDWKISEYFSAGTFKETHDTSFPPENIADYNGWKIASMKPNKVSMDFIELLGRHDICSAYALCEFEVFQPITAQVRFGFNDAVKVWVIKDTEQKCIYDYFGESTVLPDKEVIPISFEKGKYKILLKITNNKNNWGFTLRITDTKGNNVPENVIKITTN